MNLLEKRKNISYLKRFLIFGSIYLVTNVANGIDAKASLGVFQIFGGYLMGPILFILIYSLLYLPVLLLRLLSGEFNLKNTHLINIFLTKVFFDISVLYLIASIFIPGLFYE